MNLRRKAGQSTAEYAILIGIVVAVAIAMQTYVKRSLQGGVKYAVDKVQKSGTTQGQYEPYYLKSSYNTTTGAHTDTEQTTEGGNVIRTSGEKSISRTGSQTTQDSSGAD